MSSLIQYQDPASGISVLALGVDTGSSRGASRLVDQIAHAIKGEREVVVDLSDSSHLSGPALISVLRGLGFFNPFNSGPRVVLANAPDHVLRALELSGMARDIQNFTAIEAGISFLVSERH